MNTKQRTGNNMHTWKQGIARTIALALSIAILASPIQASGVAGDSEGAPEPITNGIEAPQAEADGDVAESVGSEAEPVLDDEPTGSAVAPQQDDGTLDIETVSAGALYHEDLPHEGPASDLGRPVEKGEDYTLFDNGDGTQTVVAYFGEVRHEDSDGTLVDYDNAVVASDGADSAEYPFTNAEGDADVKLPAAPSAETPIVVDGGTGTKPFKMHPITKGVFSPMVGSEGNHQATLVEEKGEDLYGNPRTVSRSIVYPAGAGIGLEYIPLADGVKENIILHERPESSDFAFHIEYKGTTAEVDTGGAIRFYDKKSGGLAGTIDPPTVRDSAEGENGKGADGYAPPRYTVEQGADGSYTVTLAIDPKYLASEDRAYPVIADPSFSYATNPGEISSTYVSSAEPSRNFLGEGVLKIGHSQTEGTFRAILTSATLASKIKSANILSAKLGIYGAGSPAPHTNIYVRRLTQQVYTGYADWAHMPSYASEKYGPKKLTGPDGLAEFDIKKLVQKWADNIGTYHGMMLMASSESGSGAMDIFYSGSGPAGRIPYITATFSKGDDVGDGDSDSAVPSIPGSVELDESYVEAGTGSVEVSWEDIASPSLAAIQLGVKKVSVDAGGYHQLLSEFAIDYFEIQRGSPDDLEEGSYDLYIGGLPEGCYAVYVRGVASNNKKGRARGARLHIDRTPPTLDPTLGITPSGPHDWKNAETIPYISWSGYGDLHPESLEYAITDGTTLTDEDFDSMDTAAASGAASIEGEFLGSGIWKVWLRGVDRSMNYTYPIGEWYYYDEDAPTIGGRAYILLGRDTDEYKGWISGNDPTFRVEGVRDLHSGVNTSRMLYAMVPYGAAEPEDGSPLYKDAESVSFAGENASFRLDYADRAMPAGRYDVYAVAVDNAGNRSEAAHIPYLRHSAPMNVEISAVHDEADFVREHGVYAGSNVTLQVEATDFRFRFADARVELVDRFGEVAKTLRTGAVIKAAGKVNIPFDTTAVKNGRYTLRFTGTDMMNKESHAELPICIDNEIGFPSSLSLAKKYVNTPEALLKWDFEDGLPINLVRLECAVSPGGVYIQAAEAGDRNGFGETVIPFTPGGDGEYKAIVRAVGYGRDPGMFREDTAELPFVLDRTPPQVEISAYRDGLVCGSVTDENLKGWIVYIKPKGAPLSERKELGRGTEPVPFGTFLSADMDALPAGSYEVSVVAEDLAGNSSEASYDVLKADIGDALTGTSIRIKEFYQDVNAVNRKQAGLNLAAVPPNTLPDGAAAWYLDGEKRADGNSFKDDFNDGAKYREGEVHNIFAVAGMGTADAAMTGLSGGGRFFEDSFAGAKGSGYDGTVVTGGCLALSEGAVSGSATLLSANMAGSFSSFRLGARSDGARFFVSIDGGEYSEAQPDKEYSVTGFGSACPVADCISVKAELSGAGARVEYFEVSGTFVRQDKFYVTYVGLYQPVNLRAAGSSNYKPVVTWNIPCNRELPDDVTYSVYKGSDSGFTPSAENMVASGISAQRYQDMHANAAPAWYKVRAEYVTGGTEKIREHSQDAAALCSSVFSIADINGSIGDAPNRSYADFNTPNASMRIEKSSGNLMYAKTDFSLGGAAFSPSLSRTYNSYADIETEFGKGFDHSYNYALLKAGSGKFGKADYFVYKGADGRLSPLPRKVRDGAYTLSEPTDMRLTPEAITHELSFNEGVGGGSAGTVKSEYSLRVSDSCFQYFNAMGEIVLERDDKANFVIYQRDADSGLIHGILNNAKEGLAFRYAEGSDKVARIDMKDGSRFSYSYKNGYLVSQRHHPAGGGKPIAYEYGYSKAGGKGKEGASMFRKLSLVKDAKGNGYRIAYDGRKTVRAAYPSGETLRFRYSSGATALSKTKGKRTISKERTEFDGAGRVTREVAANGSETLYSYKSGLLTKTTSETWTVALSGGEVKAADAPIKTESETKYDEDGNPVTETDDEDDSKTTYTYDGQGRALTERTVSDGVETTVFYEYVPVKGKDGLNLADEKVKTRTIVGGEAESSDSETLDAYGNTIASSGKEEGIYSSEASKYDDHGNLVSSVSTEGKGDLAVSGTETEYDAMNRAVKETAYEEDGKGARHVTSTVTHEHDGFGREIRTRTEYPNGDSEETRTSYDDNGSATSHTDANGISVHTEYDCMNKAVSVRTVGGGRDTTSTVRESYEDIEIDTPGGGRQVKNALKTVSTDPEGNRSVTYADNMGRTVRSVSCGIVTDTAHTPDGKAFFTISRPAGGGAAHATANAYDERGNTVATVEMPSISKGRILVSGRSVVTETAYDDLGNEISSTDGNGHTTRYEYGTESRDKVTKAVLPDGAATKYSYSDYATETVDANGGVSVARTDSAGREVSVGDYGKGGSKTVTSFSYDSRSRLSRTAYENGDYEQMSYDSRGRQSSVRFCRAGGSVESSRDTEYDSKGRVAKTTDRNASGMVVRSTAYAYNAFGQAVRETETDSATGTVAVTSYAYDSMGRVSLVTYPMAGQGAVSGAVFSYGKYGRLARVYAVIGGREMLLRSYAYDAWGRVFKITDRLDPAAGTDSDTLVKSYTYDAFGRVERMSTAYGSAPGDEIERYGYAYDKGSQITEATFFVSGSGLGERRTYSYDSAGRLSRSERSVAVPTGAALDNVTKGYVAGLHLGTSQALSDEWSKGLFGYLALAGEEYVAVESRTYGYDSVGNRVSEAVESGAASSPENFGAYAPLLEAMGVGAGENATHRSEFDGLNRLVLTESDTSVDGKYSTSYRYDANGNQISERTASAGGITDVKRSYDAANRLVRTSSAAQGGAATVTENAYNGGGQRIAKTVSQGGAHETSNYFYQGGAVAMTLDGGGRLTGRNILGASGSVISAERFQSGESIGLYSYGKDSQGSTMSIYAQDGSLAAGYRYGDFGQTERLEPASSDGGAAAVSFPNEICYTGGMYDESTGEYYLNARYYDPEAGRFLTADTYRGEETDPSSLHLYAYCANNPINFVDPSGHWKVGRHMSLTKGITIKHLKQKLRIIKQANGETDKKEYYMPPTVYKEKKGKTANKEEYARRRSCHGWENSEHMEVVWLKKAA
ncbi:MAG: DNRLRE domain-containing protein, partial [Clostridiales Family XIII bacterium]|nr:DNRLRE domain-containing protein [Clostridiales Family XIII bacterium]